MVTIRSKKTTDKVDSKKKNIKNKLRKNKDSDSDSDEEEYVTDSDSTYEPPKLKKSKIHHYKKMKDEMENDDDEEEDEDIEDSDEEEDDEEEDEDDEEDEDEDDEKQLSRGKLQQIISEIFPSAYMKKRAKNTQEIEKKYSDKTSKSSTKNKEKKKKQSNKKKKKMVVYDSSEDESEEEYESEEYDEEDEEDEEDDSAEKFYNILLVDGQGEGEGEDEYNEDDDDVECDSEDEKTFMKENYKQDEDEVVSTKKSKKTNKNKSISVTEPEEVELVDVEQEYLELVDTKNGLTKQLKNKPKSKVLLKAIEDCNKSIKKLVQKTRIKNAKNYHKLIHADKKRTNEIDYFKKKLSNKEQLTVMKHLKEINSHTNIEKPYRLALLDTNMPAKFKAVAMQKLSMLKSMQVGDNEYFKVKNWVDTFMRIPFGIYRNLSISMDSGIDACHEYMENAMLTLDNCVYGLNDAKMQIMQMIGQWISNPSAMGTAIAIKGPMGTGKTTLVKDGISKILGREFAFIALGGTGDSSFLEGHSYTYEGSSWGKIVQTLIDSKSMNPVIYFDELDKISDTPRGEEIVGILTHLTDTSQNSQFHDKYFSEVDFDLSKCLFIFSYNDESKVNPILRDRMYRIQTKGYDASEKVTISRKYLLPKIREQVNFKEGDVIIPDETIKHIVSTDSMTKQEDGVRNLKRCLEIIHTKLNLFRLMKKDTPLFDKELKLEVTFPFTVNPKEADILIQHDKTQNQSFLAMYV
jgi:ATP-dependent Lon protease